MALGAGARKNPVIVGVSPDRLVEGEAGPLGGDVAELAVASVTELDEAALATLLGDGASAGEGLERGGRGKALTIITELGQEGGGEEGAGAGERVEDVGVGVLKEEMVEELLGRFLGLDEVEEQGGEENGFLLIDVGNIRSGLGIRSLKTGKGSGKFLGMGIAVVTSKGLEGVEGELSGGVRGGERADEGQGEGSVKLGEDV